MIPTLYFTFLLINRKVKYEQTMTATMTEDRLSETFAALANPMRRAILIRLADGEASVNEIAAPFDVTLPAISRHIKVLEQAGLVTQGKRAQYRPCKIEASPLKEISAWTEQYRPIWEARFDRMDDYLQQIQDNPKENSK